MTTLILANSKRNRMLGTCIRRGGWFGNPYNRFRIHSDYVCDGQRIRIVLRYCTRGRKKINVSGFEISFLKYNPTASYWGYFYNAKVYMQLRWWQEQKAYTCYGPVRGSSIVPSAALRDSFTEKINQILEEHRILLQHSIQNPS